MNKQKRRLRGNKANKGKKIKLKKQNSRKSSSQLDKTLHLKQEQDFFTREYLLNKKEFFQTTNSIK